MVEKAQTPAPPSDNGHPVSGIGHMAKRIGEENIESGQRTHIYRIGTPIEKTIHECNCNYENFSQFIFH